MTNPGTPRAGGYGNIYTPHAGSMIIQVQRESGLANRTIVLSQRQVRLLRVALCMAGALLVVGSASWVFLAAQAARVPFLTHRVTTLQHDVRRLDTLQVALTALERRFQHVQHMLGASGPPRGPLPDVTAVRAPTAVGADAEPPMLWPLPTRGTLLPADSSGSALPRLGIDLAVPAGTPVRAAGAGTVVDIVDQAPDGKQIRLAHTNGYETLYAQLSEILITRGAHVAAGAVIGRSGPADPSAPPRLRFEMFHAGAAIDPLRIVRQGATNGDVQ